MNEEMAKFLADGLADNEPDSPCETFCPIKRTPCKFWQDGCDAPDQVCVADGGKMDSVAVEAP